MKRPSVDPTFTFAIALVLSLVLWYPTLRATMAGSLDITDAGIRYFIALAIAWGGTYGVSALVAMYASQPRRPANPPPGVRADDVPQRRHDDEPAPPAEESDISAA